MEVIKRVSMDLATRGVRVCVDAVQGDGNTRRLEISLTENGENWIVPDETFPALAYRKPDGTSGLYDKLPSGASAVTVSANRVTMALAPQVLSAPGKVEAALVLLDKNMNQLAAFPFTILVAPNPAAGKGISNDYYNCQTLGDINTALKKIDVSITGLNGELDGLEDISVGTEAKAVDLAFCTDGYYSTSGELVPDVGRKYCIVPVEENEKYLVTTNISSTLIAGVIYRNANNEVLSYDLVGTGHAKIISDYEIIIPANCTNIIVQGANVTREMSLQVIKQSLKETVVYQEREEIRLGENILADVKGYYVSDTGWSGNNANGYSHSVGYSASLTFSTEKIEEGAIYICDFDTTFTEDEFVNVGIGTQYRIPVYNGTAHIQIPLLASGNKTLYFSPLSSVAFTISNIALRKVNGGNNKENLELFSTLTNNHSHNLGFWNVLLGADTAKNAVGATRTVAIGFAALNALQGGHRNVAIGTFAMSQMLGGENNVSIGADSMLAIQKALDCIAIGKGTMYNGQIAEDNVAIGHYALTGSADSDNSKRNVAIGKNAGWHCSGQDNTFAGYQSGLKCKNTNGNVCIGKNAYGGESGNHNTCIGENTEFASGASNSTAIGYGVKTTKSDQVVIGNTSVSEVVFCGNKKINFNSDGTVTWEMIGR